jgi:hypothetical protein
LNPGAASNTWLIALEVLLVEKVGYGIPVHTMVLA